MEESAPLSSQASTESSHAEVLAGESSAHQVNWCEVPGSDLSDVSVPFDLGPVASEDLAGGGIEFNLPLALEPGSFEGEVKSADPGEEGAKGSTATHADPTTTTAHSPQRRRSAAGRGEWSSTSRNTTDRPQEQTSPM